MVYEKDVLLVFNEAVIYSFSFKSINIYDKKIICLLLLALRRSSGGGTNPDAVVKVSFSQKPKND